MKLEKFKAEKLDLKSTKSIYAGQLAASTATIGGNTSSSETDPDSNADDSDRPPIIIVPIQPITDPTKIA